MSRTLIVVAVLDALAALPALSQQPPPTPNPPVRIGTHVAGNMMNGPFDLYRIGGQVVIPVSMRLALYPSISRFLDKDEAEWEYSAALRYRPFGPREGDSPLYLGVGVAGINWGGRKAPHTTSGSPGSNCRAVVGGRTSSFSSSGRSLHSLIPRTIGACRHTPG